jgi:hypothetical protein
MASALLAVLARPQQSFEATAADFDRAFQQSADQQSACRALALLLQDPTLLRDAERLAALAVLASVYHARRSDPSSHALVVALVEARALAALLARLAAAARRTLPRSHDAAASAQVTCSRTASVCERAFALQLLSAAGVSEVRHCLCAAAAALNRTLT